MIQNTNIQNIFRPHMQNLGLQKIVTQINANVGTNKRFDTVALSKKAQALLDESNETKVKDKETILNYENSDMVSSITWGTHTKAEFAEMSLSSQRNDLKTFSDQIDYAKSKLEFTMGKISELENFLNGTGPHNDPHMTKETAKNYLLNYKQSIIDDYANFALGKSQYHADEFDKLSGGLASAILENQLHSLNAESLGLTNLSSDPKEIMKALENASKVLGKMTSDLESAFLRATDGKGFTQPARSMSIFDGDSPLDFFVSQMEKPFATKEFFVSDFNLSGEILEIDKALLTNLDSDDIT